MPELPECEAARRLVASHCTDRKITNVTFNFGDGREIDGKIMQPAVPARWADALVGSKISKTGRKGKRIYWVLEDQRGENAFACVFSFGMTGAFSVKGIKPQDFMEFTVDDSSWPPRFCRMVVSFEDGAELSYTDPRRFGKIQLIDTRTTALLEQEPLVSLATDPLDNDSMPTLKEFMEKFRSKSTTVKAGLLDQKFVFCGLGNWLVDDICHEASIAPASKCNALSDKECEQLMESTVYICKTAVKAGAVKANFPSSWLFHLRWGAKKRKNGKKKQALRTEKGEPITVGTVAGRTTLFVPSRQKLKKGRKKRKRE
eukprot:g964.t1